MRLLHLSDPHFGAEQSEVVEALLRLAWELAPQAILVSGDLTQRATPLQFDRARQFLQRLPPVPRLVMPGNHDLPLFQLWQRWRRPYARYEAAIAPCPPQGVAQLELPGVLVVAADTTRWWRHRHGTLSAAQIDTVARLLQQSRHNRPGQWRIVMTHHPLRVQHARDREDRPWRHARAQRRWVDAGCDLLLSGHLHEPALLPIGDHTDGSPQCWLAQAGSCSSWRLPPGGVNSVQLLTAGRQLGSGRRCVRYDYDREIRRFQQAASARLDGGPPLRAPRAAPAWMGSLG